MALRHRDGEAVFDLAFLGKLDKMWLNHIFVSRGLLPLELKPHLDVVVVGSYAGKTKHGADFIWIGPHDKPALQSQLNVRVSHEALAMVGFDKWEFDSDSSVARAGALEVSFDSKEARLLRSEIGNAILESAPWKYGGVHLTWRYGGKSLLEAKSLEELKILMDLSRR